LIGFVLEWLFRGRNRAFALAFSRCAFPGFSAGLLDLIANSQPVVITGAEAPDLIETPTRDIWAFRYDAIAGHFVQVPVQVDERALFDLTHGMAEPMWQLTYDWDGQDDGLLDAGDQIAFMARDLGDRVHDPLDDEDRWIYLFVSSTTSDADPALSYVQYTAVPRQYLVHLTTQRVAEADGNADCRQEGLPGVAAFGSLGRCDGSLPRCSQSFVPCFARVPTWRLRIWPCANSGPSSRGNAPGRASDLPIVLSGSLFAAGGRDGRRLWSPSIPRRSSGGIGKASGATGAGSPADTAGDPAAAPRSVPSCAGWPPRTPPGARRASTARS
jgi:hypothetical protein